jgi:hypothetical protein
MIQITTAWNYITRSSVTVWRSSTLFAGRVHVHISLSKSRRLSVAGSTQLEKQTTDNHQCNGDRRHAADGNQNGDGGGGR